ncbi:non-ribosomal peptide synthetase [Streptomyces sp. NPDC088812]|uniref:non-ribosomal peptide synthetase n=1 Tax=Streptomyces sp. NPDC088812 TaxID=3365905 RepID=UPI00381D8712
MLLPDRNEAPPRPETADHETSTEPSPGSRGGPVTDAEVPVHRLVARIARSRPRNIAVHSAGRAISYRELLAWSARIASRLTEAGVGRGSRVGLIAEPSAAAVAAVLGVLAAGAAYVPVDPAHPERRIAEVLADAGVTAVVVTATTRDKAAGLGLPLLRADDAEPPPGTRDPAGTPPAVPTTAEDPAYLIYTSGSTGEPKGVLVEHGQLAASTSARRTVYPGSPVFLLVSPLAFDSSVAGLWGTLTTGGRLVVATTDEVRDPERLVALIERHRVTTLLCVPSLYGVLLDAAERAGTRRLRSLDTVITAGEPLSEPLVHRHFALHRQQVALVNEYGPTEATVWASYHRFDGPGPVSIGRPVPGARLYVLDELRRPVPPGVQGELYIAGPGVTRGYFGRPDATARAFFDDPFAGADGGRMYATGDLVRWNAGDTLDFLGRRDHQLKIRGHRVELGAVEAALRSAPEVRDAVVVADDEHTRLTAFVAAPPGTDAVALRARVADRLPAVMVPSSVQVLDGLPLTVNGKADRERLRKLAATLTPGPSAPARPAPAPAVAGRPSDADLTAQVAAAWAEVLKVHAAPPADVNFFDAGGQSLTMFQLQDALERHTGVRPSVVALFRHTTVSAQAEVIRAARERPQDARSGDRSPDAAPADGPSARRARAARSRRSADTDGSGPR